MNTFTELLIKWYEENRRDLPWRDTRDPYLIWISEIILQQTRVNQGYEYFLRFVKRFPDISHLANASEDEVMKYWQGLGYYSRARNLYAAAKSMRGVFPSTYNEVRQLKGVGPYTAAAICSIAYDMPYAVVDGNVYRVLSRYFGVEMPIDSAKGQKFVSSLANEMLDKCRPALYNQANMDFGALQCTPKKTSCISCPLAEGCFALRNNRVSQLPVKERKVQIKNRYFNYIYVRAGSYTYLHKRIEDDIWRNMYELPLIETDMPATEEEFAMSSQLKLLLSNEEHFEIRPLWLNVKHVLSHRVIYANFYEVILSEKSSSFSTYLRVRQEDLENYAVPRLIHAFLEKYL